MLQVNWMRQNAIGGIMLSSLDMDDFSGLFCTGEIYPLLHAIHNQLKAPLPVDAHFYKGTLDAQTPIINTVESTTWGLDFLSTAGLNYDGTTDIPLSTPSSKSETIFKPKSSAAMMQSSSEIPSKATNTSYSATELSIENSASSLAKSVMPDSITVSTIDRTTGAPPVTMTESPEISEIKRILKDAANRPTHSLINSIISLIEGNQILAASSKQNSFSNGLMRMDNSVQRPNLARSPEWAPQPLSQRTVSEFARPFRSQRFSEAEQVSGGTPVFGPRFAEPRTVSEIKHTFNNHQNALKEKQPLGPKPIQLFPKDEDMLSKNFVQEPNLGYVA